ncbi:hypothetical protein M0R72_12275 [Candidatus Pacearchaeota archaeon]|nr:hypothetical protein [Candidatus Pacearchaeota archaeon]
MTMIIADLDEPNHQYLTAYKLKNEHRTIPKALNAWMKETREKSQLFR